MFNGCSKNPPTLPGVGEAMQGMIDAREIAGAVTLVATKDEIIHLHATGFADVEEEIPLKPDTLFWIASMTKPITATAVLMLQDEDKLDIDDPVAKYLPEFADLKTPSGLPANLTIKQILTHTSGMGEGSREVTAKTTHLTELIPAFLAAPMLAEPGTTWRYCQSGINTAARIVEVVSGQSFEKFLAERLFGPLGMQDTLFYPTELQAARMTLAYEKNDETGAIEVSERRFDPRNHDRPPLGNGGLFSTAVDYVRYCQMLMNNGTLDGREYLTPESVALLHTDFTTPLEAGFLPGSAWGLATSIVVEPQGVTAGLHAGTYGHGGAHGTQVWIDPVSGLVQILMIQRTDLPNSDGSVIRKAFHDAVAAAVGH